MFDEVEEPMNKMSDWEKENKRKQEAIKSRLEGMAKGSKSDIAKSLSKQKKNSGDKSVSVNCELISMLCYEAQDQLRSGKMNLKEVISDLCEALESLEDSKAEESEDKEE